MPAAFIPTPEGYTDWLAELKTRIHTAQQRAMLAVNRRTYHVPRHDRSEWEAAAD